MTEVERRREAIIERRGQGWTWKKIGEEHGVSITQAAKLYKLGLGDREKRKASAAQAVATLDTPVEQLGFEPALTFALIHLGCTDLASVFAYRPESLTSALLTYPKLGRRSLVPLDRLRSRFQG